jgi:gamma-glutamyl-gamma-aminobutyrate hydrolase PuuD
MGTPHVPLTILVFFEERNPPMFTSDSTLRLAVYAIDEGATKEARGCGLWPVGYAGTIKAAGANPVFFQQLPAGESWKETLVGIDGVIVAESFARTPNEIAIEENLCKFCKRYRVPLLGIDRGMLTVNAALGGSNYTDLARELPEALQHRHPPERGSRHAITVTPDTKLAALYGEGEVIVNSEHRQAVKQPAKGFRVSALALDGVIEAMEWEADGWHAMAVQWRPASATASGLDIQVFRGLIDAAVARQREDAGAEACHAA